MRAGVAAACVLVWAAQGIACASSTSGDTPRKPSRHAAHGAKSTSKPGPKGARTKLPPPRPKAAVKTVAANKSLAAAVKTEGHAIGARLLARLRAGSISLVNPERDAPQIKSLAGQGCLCEEGGKPVSVSLNLLRTLDRLSSRASKQHPLGILSLYRTPRAGRKNEPHANGLAVDISAIAGRKIDSRDPAQAQAGVLALIESMGPGEYRFGMPKPPGTDPVALAPAPPRPPSWPFFPAPLPVVMPLPGPGLSAVSLVLPRPGPKGGSLSSRAIAAPWVRKWQNERGASVTELGSAPLRAAILRAAQRGVVIHTLFPDALDHLHLDVVPPPGKGRGPAITFDCCGD